jgi:predicted nuclease with TOPRIM domain
MFWFRRKRTNYKALYEKEQESSASLRRLVEEQQSDVAAAQKAVADLEQEVSRVTEDNTRLAKANGELLEREVQFKSFGLIIAEMFEKCGTALDELPEGVLPEGRR